MSVGVEERLLIALAVNVYQKRAQVAQQRLGSELIVDEYLIAAARGKFTPDNYFMRLAFSHLRCLPNFANRQSQCPRRQAAFAVLDFERPKKALR